MFLKAQMGKWIESLTTVDSNKTFVELGKQHFGFHEDAELESVITDAHQFVTQAKTESYDLVFMDVCYEVASEEGISPPRHFLAPDFIESLQRILKKEGVCAINTMIKNEEAKHILFKQISEVKDTTKYRSKCYEDLNEVLFLVKGAEVASGKQRAAMVQKNVQAMGMQNGIWLAKKGGMPIVHHAEQMERL